MDGACTHAAREGKIAISWGLCTTLAVNQGKVSVILKSSRVSDVCEDAERLELDALVRRDFLEAIGR
jgi:hypothetical protein